MDVGEILVIWTARLMVLAYLYRLGADAKLWPVTEIKKVSGDRTTLRIWTLGGLLYLIHVILAFHFMHHWSHLEAWKHTAEQTRQVTGWYWGGGLWINYGLLCWWCLDLMICFRYGLARLSRRYVCCLHAVFGFLFFNATVVFGPAWWKWLGVLLIAAVGTGTWLQRSRHESGNS